MKAARPSPTPTADSRTLGTAKAVAMVHPPGGEGTAVGHLMGLRCANQPEVAGRPAMGAASVLRDQQTLDRHDALARRVV